MNTHMQHATNLTNLISEKDQHTRKHHQLFHTSMWLFWPSRFGNIHLPGSTRKQP